MEMNCEKKGICLKRGYGIFTGFPSSRQIRRAECASAGAYRRHGASERDAQRRANARAAMCKRPERGARTDGAEDEAGRPVLPERHRGPGDGRQRRRRLTSGQGSQGRHDIRRSTALRRIFVTTRSRNHKFLQLRCSSSAIDFSSLREKLRDHGWFNVTHFWIYSAIKAWWARLDDLKIMLEGSCRICSSRFFLFRRGFEQTSFRRENSFLYESGSKVSQEFLKNMVLQALSSEDAYHRWLLLFWNSVTYE